MFLTAGRFEYLCVLSQYSTEEFVSLTVSLRMKFSPDLRNLSVNIRLEKTVSMNTALYTCVYTVRVTAVIQGKIEPASYSLSLSSIDGVKNPDSFSSLPVGVVPQENDVVLNVTLPRRRLWNYTILPHNCSDAISDIAELSKYMKVQ